MNIFAFLKNHIPSFEDEFVQSESEREMENAPASARRGRSRKVSHIEGEHESIGNLPFVTGSLEKDMALNIGIFSNSID
jgi:hypothetical protein